MKLALRLWKVLILPTYIICQWIEYSGFLARKNVKSDWNFFLVQLCADVSEMNNQWRQRLPNRAETLAGTRRKPPSKVSFFEIKMLTRSIERLLVRTSTHAHTHIKRHMLRHTHTYTHSLYSATHNHTLSHALFKRLRQSPGLSSNFDGIPVSCSRWYVAC